MSNKILYSPKEGTTGFWGLRGYPEVPPQPSDFDHSPTKWSDYREALESCKEKKLEIVNPEECFTYGPYARNGSNEVIKFKEGDIFDLPIGYQLEKGGYCEGCRRAGMYHCAHADTCGSAKDVFRLVKTKTKEQPELINDRIVKNILNSRPDLSPEPEESQEKLFKELFVRFGGTNWYHAENEFVIQRKKQ